MTHSKQNRATRDRSTPLEPGTKTPHSLEGHRILILAGDHDGEEGICLGKIAATDRWAVSPDSSTAILELHFESDFALLLNLAAAPSQN